MIVRPDNLLHQIREYRRKLIERGDEDKYDLYNFITRYCKIITVTGELTSIIMYPGQERLFETIYEDYYAGKPVRIIVYKIRQIGISTIVVAIFKFLTFNEPFKSAVIISHEDEEAEDLYKKATLMYENLPLEYKQARPLTSAEPKVDKLEYAPPHYSSLIYRTAKNLNIKRGSTIQYVLGSEMSRWPDASTLCSSIDAACHEVPGTILIYESTPHGIGNLFWRRWDNAKKGKNNYTPIFLSFPDAPFYSIPMEPEEKLDLTPEQEDYYIEHNPAPETMKWIANKLNNWDQDWEKFNREYPINDTIGFLGSGKPWFKTNILQGMADKHCQEPSYICQLKWEPDKWICKKCGRKYENEQPYICDKCGKSEYKFIEGSGIKIIPKEKMDYSLGRWFVEVYKEPEIDRFYIMTGDVGEGVSGDFTIFDTWLLHELKSTILLEQAAKYITNQRNAWDAGIHAFMLGSWYNWPLILIERTGGLGLVTLRGLENGFPGNPQTEGGYPYLYYERTIIQKTDEITRRLGWSTSRTSKKDLLGTHQSKIQDELMIIHSERTLNEHFGFIRDDEKNNWLQQNPDPVTNKPHDDEVMAAAMAWPCLKEWQRAPRLLPRIKSGAF